MRRVALALAVALTAVAGASAATPPSSGLRGVVKQPKAPVCLDGASCDGLARGVTLVFVRRGSTRARATTRDDGTYRVRLAPGRYTVRIAPSDGVARLSPGAVTVPTGRIARVNFFVDNGIRQP